MAQRHRDTETQRHRDLQTVPFPMISNSLCLCVSVAGLPDAKEELTSGGSRRRSRPSPHSRARSKTKILRGKIQYSRLRRMILDGARETTDPAGPETGTVGESLALELHRANVF